MRTLRKRLSLGKVELCRPTFEKESRMESVTVDAGRASVVSVEASDGEGLRDALRLDTAKVKSRLDEVVRSTVEEMLRSQSAPRCSA